MDNKILKFNSNKKFKMRRSATNKIIRVLINAFFKRRQIENSTIDTKKVSQTVENLTKSMPSLNTQYDKFDLLENDEVLKESADNYNIKSCDIIDLIKKLKLSDNLKCVHCGDMHIVKNGIARGKQRYKCKSCNKTFISLHGTPFMGSHHIYKWIGFIECTLKSLSLREASKILGISHVTLFYWRHKLLSALRKVKIVKLKGVIGITETHFMYSEKGKRNIKDREPRKRGAYVFEKMYGKKVCTLAVKDEIDTTLSRIACIGRLGRNHIEGVIGKYIDNSNELCTGSLSAYVSYSNMKKIMHHRMVGIGDKLNGDPNIKNVIEFVDRLKEWILIFRGVATKYLNNYLGWHKFLESVNYTSNLLSVEEVLKSI